MELTKSKITPPLKKDSFGTIRVGGTRVTLETVLIAFKGGSTCEEIAIQFPSLSLTDVYSTIAFYLVHTSKAEAYLTEQEKAANLIQQRIEERFPSQDIRQRLLMRKRQN